MEKIDDGLKALLESGKEKGYLTYSQVNDYLPDDAVNPKTLDELLLLLEEQGIELIDESEAEEREGGPSAATLTDEERADLDLSFMDDEESRRIIKIKAAHCDESYGKGVPVPVSQSSFRLCR